MAQTVCDSNLVSTQLCSNCKCSGVNKHTSVSKSNRDACAASAYGAGYTHYSWLESHGYCAYGDSTTCAPSTRKIKTKFSWEINEITCSAECSEITKLNVPARLSDHFGGVSTVYGCCDDFSICANGFPCDGADLYTDGVGDDCTSHMAPGIPWAPRCPLACPVTPNTCDPGTPMGVEVCSQCKCKGVHTAMQTSHKTLNGCAKAAFLAGYHYFSWGQPFHGHKDYSCVFGPEHSTLQACEQERQVTRWRKWSIYKAYCDPRTAPPVAQPTTAPSVAPVAQPTKSPSFTPTDEPSPAPTPSPTDRPTNEPTPSPTFRPTDSPSDAPHVSPTEDPSVTPTDLPTPSPTNPPTNLPTPSPTNPPTNLPTPSPTNPPTDMPVVAPSKGPSTSPVTRPSKAPVICNVPVEMCSSCKCKGAGARWNTGHNTLEACAAATYAGGWQWFSFRADRSICNFGVTYSSESRCINSPDVGVHAEWRIYEFGCPL